MSLIHKILLNCKDATYLVSKKQETKISFVENIQLSLHLLVCKVCLFFSKQTNFLHQHLIKLNSESCEHHYLQLDETKKAALQLQLDTESEK